MADQWLVVLYILLLCGGLAAVVGLPLLCVAQAARALTRALRADTRMSLMEQTASRGKDAHG